MNKTIKTRHVVKNIKTLADYSGAIKLSKTTAIKTKEIAITRASPYSEQNETSNQETRKGVSPMVRKAENHLQSSVGRAIKKRGADRVKKVLNSRQLKRNTFSEHPNIKTKVPRASVVSKHPGKKIGQKVLFSASSTNPLKTIMRQGGYSKTKRIAQTIKSSIHAMRASVKMAIAALKSLGAIIAAFGFTTLSVVVIVCLVAFIAASAFGIFFAGGDMGDNNPPLREVITKINEEHSERIEAIKADNPHDQISLSGARAPWKEILSVFAVKTTTDADKHLDVLTLDSVRQELLKNVFWDMNQIESHIEEKEITEIVQEEDEKGNIVEVNKTTTEKILFIDLSCQSANDAGNAYGFTPDQMNTLLELLSARYDSLWSSVLYGTSQGSGDIVNIAASQIGNVGGKPYWSWYGFSSRVEWCACFVSWCANECGLIEGGIIPKFSYCPTGVQWFKDAARWKDRGYTPQPGSIIFFDWDGDNTSDHVGIVESSDGTNVHTIEGNSGDSCRRNSYSVNSTSILGYGILQE